MATEVRYKVFKEIYDEEGQRYLSLGTRSNLYLTVITFYLGVVLLKVDDLLKFTSDFGISIVWFLCVGILLVSALAFTIRAVDIRDYEGVCDPERVIEAFGDTPPSDEDFLDDRVVDMAVATSRNSAQNDRAARLLQWSARTIFLAVVLQVVVFAVTITHASHSRNQSAQETEKSIPCGTGH